MGIRVIVFDFDGTLIDSNQVKADAYFKLFPDDKHHTRIIRDVLSEIFEQSRYVIFEQILRKLGVSEGGAVREQVKQLAARYDEIAVAAAKTCPEKAGAEEALRRYAPAYGLYVSSTTPEDSLKEIIRYRKWDRYFKAVFGYPRKKAETLQRIIALETVSSEQVLVVGDGHSDRQSALENGCPFVQVAERFPLEELDRIITATS
jgi:phosphoglycolate phosphatase-like HAD superfamily hydrolase